MGNKEFHDYLENNFTVKQIATMLNFMDSNFDNVTLDIDKAFSQSSVSAFSELYSGYYMMPYDEDYLKDKCSQLGYDFKDNEVNSNDLVYCVIISKSFGTVEVNSFSKREIIDALIVEVQDILGNVDLTPEESLIEALKRCK